MKLTLAVILGGVLLYAVNALLTATILPSAIGDFGGIAYITWPTAAFFASSIAAASGAGLLKTRIGASRAFVLAAIVFALGAMVCAFSAGMNEFVAGRFLQGAGGGLLSALAYVLVQNNFPESMWPRAFALISGSWGVAVLLGPLIGGVFANAGSWRGAFFFVAAAAGLLAVAAAAVLTPDRPQHASTPVYPLARLGLLALSIVAMSVAQVTSNASGKALLILLSVGSAAWMLRLDRVSRAPLFPSGAFSWRGVIGPGLWMTLLLAISNDPFPIYGPLFLQQLHHLDPLQAGYLVALEALSWTIVALIVAGFSRRSASALIVAGPLVMGAGLLAIAFVMPAGTIVGLLLPIFCAGAGIGSCWAFMAQRVMAAATPEETDITASAVPTVQLFGLAFGGAVAGLIANVVGYSEGLTVDNTRVAAFWVPASFVIVTIGASMAGLRMVSAASES